MFGEFSVHRISIKAKLISSYLIILGAGGLATSLLGSWIVSSNLLKQVWRTLDVDLAHARSIYDNKVQAVRLPIEFAADTRDLARLRQDGGYDFLELKSRPDGPAVKAAFAGTLVSGTEERSEGLALITAAPVRGPHNEVQAVLYGGMYVGRNPELVDNKPGLMTIFRGDTRIATSVRLGNGGRALGSRAAPEISEAVLRQGKMWRGRTLVEGQWLLAEYDPIRDYSGGVVGMLAVALPENIYTATRNRVILSFFAIASVGFVIIIGMTYYMIRNITRPLGVMVEATHNIIFGRFDQEVHIDSPGEIEALAESFNVMLHSLRRMKGDLEEWGSTLEQKVKQRTEELSAMQARMAQSERLASLGMLAAGVAHEVNNPLGGILALTGLTLEDMSPSDPNRENLEEVIRQTERCRDIVNRLLEFSRQSKTETELVDMNEILDKTLALLSKQSAFFNVNIVKRYDPELPAVLADRSQFQQVFMNLLMNAAQAMNEHGTVVITTRVNGDNVEIAIADTGCGIPRAQINRIFDPFFTTKASGQGTGLGLSITYGIVSKHGGAISVESEPGKGATFTISLPVSGVREGALS